MHHCSTCGTGNSHRQPEWSTLEIVGAVAIVAVAVTLVFVPHVMAAGTGAGLVGVGTKMLTAAFGNSGPSCGS